MGTRKFYVTNLEPSCHKQKALTKQELNTLFDAIELSWYSKVCSLVTSPGLDINGLNEDGMTPLDTALLLGDTPVARVLQHHGATESSRYSDQPGLRQQHVLALLHEAEMQRSNVISNPLNTTLPNSNNSLEGIGGVLEKKLWKYHSMLSTLRKTSLPRVPAQFVVSVVSGTSVRVECYEPVDNRSSLVTQYKIEWSTCPNFQSCVCSEIITAGHHMSHVINGLNKGTCYYFVVQAGNIKGFGGSSNIKKSTPSHWADNKGTFDELQDMSTGTNMLNFIRNNFNTIFPQMFAQTPTKSKTRAKTLSRLFTAPKFVKTLQRCLYLTILHFMPGGKVLVTDSDRLPTVQVDDLATSVTSESELMWLFKLAMAGWPNFKDLREELNAHQELCGVSVRLKLVSAAIYLQEYLGMTDLGIPYYRLVKKNGVMVILLIKYSESTFNGVNTKLASPSSLDVNCVNPKDALDIIHLNMAELQVLYSRLLQPPTPGLYVGIISFRVKNEELEMVVEKGCPLLPPLEYVREVSNVTEEEWGTLKGEKQDESNLLCKQVGAAVSALLVRLHGTDEDVSSYSLYTATVIEIGETSVMLIIPPELVSPLGQENGTEGTITVPLHNYEIFFNHQKHSRLCETLLHCSTNINTCQLLLSQKMRQTICNDEVSVLKEARLKLDKLNESLSTIWTKYSYSSEVLSQCINDTAPLRKMSDILQSGESPASSITEGDPVPDKMSGVIRIYNSSELGTGPPCIKLHITGSTTCRDVVNSVVRKVRRQQDSQPPLDVELQALGLVATLDNSAQFIPDHFQLLRLGLPWSTAKLHVRFKSTTI